MCKRRQVREGENGIREGESWEGPKLRNMSEQKRMNYGKWGFSSQKDKQEDGDMESVGGDGVVGSLAFSSLPLG